MRVVHEVIDQHGRLEILVNGAGVTVDRPMGAAQASHAAAGSPSVQRCCSASRKARTARLIVA